tara:strand:+ start:590 stop:1528 length:939 start_codon:yes stop_codon:yes gene_type:complete
MINKKSHIFVAGHNGMVGASVIRKLKKLGYENYLTANKSAINLLDQSKVNNFFAKNKIDAVIICAAKVGGILANNIYRGEFIYENLQIQNNLIHASYQNNVSDLIFLGSSCIYPKICKQPIKEDYLLSGPLESTNEPYAIAKIAGIKLCESYNQQYKTNYKCLMPCNLYGISDNYDLNSSHFFPALIRKISNAKINNEKIINIWGSGKPKRELLFVDDLAEACIFFLKKKTKHSLINIGSSDERSISEYAKFIMNKLNVKMKISYDNSKPDGTFRKVIDSSVAKKYGWKAKTNLSDGFDIAYNDFKRRFAKK